MTETLKGPKTGEASVIEFSFGQNAFEILGDTQVRLQGAIAHTARSFKRLLGHCES